MNNCKIPEGCKLSSRKYQDDCKCNQSVFEIGDIVFSLTYGPGEITKINNEMYGVRHFNEIGLRHYFFDGKVHDSGEVVLFHEKPTVIPVKKKTKKWLWAFKNAVGGSSLSMALRTEQEINDYCNSKNYVKLPWTEIEAEE